MRLCFVAFALVLSACGTTQAQPRIAAGPIVAFDADLARGEGVVAEIGAMAGRDRLLREIIMRGFRTEMTGEERQAYIEGTRHHFDRIDGENTARLRVIIREIGWAELNALSQHAADQARTLISHSSDIAFKREMAATFEPLVRAGRMEGDYYAMLIDDIATMENRPQVYATNFECHHGLYQPKPTENVETLDARRAEIGLPPIAEYTARMREMYGECPADYSGN